MCQIFMSAFEKNSSQDKLDMEVTLEGLKRNFPERAWDVVSRRFGVDQGEKETLEAIGKSYGITRERVRQIEAETLQALKKKEEHKKILSPFHEELEMFLTEHGGLMKEEHIPARFVQHLGHEERWRGVVDLFLVLGESFKRKREDEHLHSLWYLQEESVGQAKKLLQEIDEFFQNEQRLLPEEEFKKHLKRNYPYFSKKAIFTYLECSKKVDSNVFRDFGLKEWPEISPRGVRDKAYLVAKKKAEPLHFREITEHINRVDFSDREAKPQTVHNELIKDDRFVLVGRGKYALKSWGYEPGTVKDVIKKILAENKDPLHQDDIIKKVLDRRMVKEGTVKFNLKANEEFAEVAEKHYTLKQ